MGPWSGVCELVPLLVLEYGKFFYDLPSQEEVVQ